jgi:hypothetical protein
VVDHLKSYKESRRVVLLDEDANRRIICQTLLLLVVGGGGSFPIIFPIIIGAVAADPLPLCHPIYVHVTLAFYRDQAAKLDANLSVRILLLQQKGRSLRAQDATGRRVGLHAAGRVDRVAKQRVPRIVRANHVGQDRAGMEPDPDLHKPPAGVVHINQRPTRRFDSRNAKLGDPQRMVVRLILDAVGHPHPGIALQKRQGQRNGNKGAMIR